MAPAGFELILRSRFDGPVLDFYVSSEASEGGTNRCAGSSTAINPAEKEAIDGSTPRVAISSRIESDSSRHSMPLRALGLESVVELEVPSERVEPWTDKPASVPSYSFCSPSVSGWLQGWGRSSFGP